MVIGYEKVNGSSDWPTVKATGEAINSATVEVLNRYVSDARLNAMLTWLRSYYRFVSAGTVDGSEPGWIHETVAEDKRWAGEQFGRLTAYRRERR